MTPTEFLPMISQDVIFNCCTPSLIVTPSVAVDLIAYSLLLQTYSLMIASVATFLLTLLLRSYIFLCYSFLCHTTRIFIFPNIILIELFLYFPRDNKPRYAIPNLLPLWRPYFENLRIFSLSPMFLFTHLLLAFANFPKGQNWCVPVL